MVNIENHSVIWSLTEIILIPRPELETFMCIQAVFVVNSFQTVFQSQGDETSTSTAFLDLHFRVFNTELFILLSLF